MPKRSKLTRKQTIMDNLPEGTVIYPDEQNTELEEDVSLNKKYEEEEEEDIEVSSTSSGYTANNSHFLRTIADTNNWISRNKPRPIVNLLNQVDPATHDENSIFSTNFYSSFTSANTHYNIKVKVCLRDGAAFASKFSDLLRLEFTQKSPTHATESLTSKNYNYWFMIPAGVLEKLYFKKGIAIATVKYPITDYGGKVAALLSGKFAEKTKEYLGDPEQSVQEFIMSKDYQEGLSPAISIVDGFAYVKYFLSSNSEYSVEGSTPTNIQYGESKTFGTAPTKVVNLDFIKDKIGSNLENIGMSVNLPINGIKLRVKDVNVYQSIEPTSVVFYKQVSK